MQVMQHASNTPCNVAFDVNQTPFSIELVSVSNIAQLVILFLLIVFL